MSIYETGRRIAGHEGRPYIDWVLYGAELDGRPGVFAALYVDARLVRRDDVAGGWYCFDFNASPPRKNQVPARVLDRARACWRPGWPLLPSQEGLL
jgi:hypothetical protein